MSDGQPSPRRKNLPFVIGLVAIAASVPIAWKVFLSGDPVTAPPTLPPVLAAPDAGPKKVELKLTQVTGHVQVKKPNGQWADAKEGDPLNASDGVRTDDGSYAVVVGGEFWEVKMEPGTEVAIGELSESISRLLLESGMAKATVRGGGRHSFEVRASKSDAVATTDGGVFTIASNGNGTVAVGTEEGAVEFLGKGRVVIVRAGQQSIVRPGQAPTEPVAIPTSLLLHVALPGRTVVNKAKLLVVGNAEPGARVSVEGHMVATDAKGHFETTLKLVEGKNSVDVVERSVGSLEAASRHQIELDTTVRKTTIDGDLWGPKKKK